MKIFIGALLCLILVFCAETGAAWTGYKYHDVASVVWNAVAFTWCGTGQSQVWLVKTPRPSIRVVCL